MKWFAIYDETGRVLRKGRGPKRAAHIGLQAGETIYWGEVPRGYHLPGGVPTPVPEAARIVHPQDVKAHAGRLLSYTDWVVIRAFDTGEAPDPAIISERQAIRDASNTIEAMNPIPADFTDPKYWP